MRTQHIIYISGLGDGYDPIRRFGLRFWRKKNVVVTHISMHWSDPAETFEMKLERLNTVIDTYPKHSTVLVGESAGGSLAIVARKRFGERVERVVTICGKNQDAGNVSERLYAANPAFRQSMIEADIVAHTLSRRERDRTLIIYSSADGTVRPHDTLVDGIEAYDLKTPGHALTILFVLFLKHHLVTKDI